MKWNWLFRFFAVLGASLGAVNLMVVMAFTASGRWRLLVDMPTLAVQIALLTAFIVFGGFGLAALGVFGMSRIEKVVVRRAEELVNKRLKTGMSRIEKVAVRHAEELVNERLDLWEEEEDAVPVGMIADGDSPPGGQPEDPGGQPEELMKE